MYPRHVLPPGGRWPPSHPSSVLLTSSNTNREIVGPSPLHPTVSPYSPLSEGPLTPPDDMDTLHHSTYQGSGVQELGRYYGKEKPIRYGDVYREWGLYDSRPIHGGYQQSNDQQSNAQQSHSIQQQQQHQNQQQQHQQHQQQQHQQQQHQHQHQHQHLQHNQPEHHTQQHPPRTQAVSPLPSHRPQPSRTTSTTSTIAPSLQIPRTINNSQGSLAELAAQITCLFWFESVGTLDLADGYCSAPAGPLNPETCPTTGFRKFVTTLLSTTQVAQNVVVLGLLFIYRLKRQNPSVKGKLGSEYRLLTVALMLGNKFLDDNTYTNKTWADVSGISVDEVHVMEVEFLSNMKYNLFTSMQQWDQWQVQLNRFARFIERASLAPQPSPGTMTLLQSGFASNTLPSPPSTYQASPPQALTRMSAAQAKPPMAAALATAATTLPVSTMDTRPASMGPIMLPAVPQQQKRKRSIEDDELMMAAKRMVHSRGHAHQFSPALHQNHGLAHMNRTANHLPPLTRGQYPGGVGSNVIGSCSSNGSGGTAANEHSWQHDSAPAATGSMNAMAVALRSAQTSRTHSPNHQVPSSNVSPSTTSDPIKPDHHSPSFFLGRRDSPYKPVRGVHTLLVPPSVRTDYQPGDVDQNQMQFQPLGRPTERHEGPLPYIAQNQWYDACGQRINRSADQWNAHAFPSSHFNPAMGRRLQQLPPPRPC